MKMLSYYLLFSNIRIFFVYFAWGSIEELLVGCPGQFKNDSFFLRYIYQSWSAR